jgi:predicted permease
MSSFLDIIAQIRSLILHKRNDCKSNDNLQTGRDKVAAPYQPMELSSNRATREARLHPSWAEPTHCEMGVASRFPWIADFFRDVREALRKWRRKPGYAAITVVTLAIGVGGNIAMYDLVNALMFRPPEGVNAADRIVNIRFADNYIRYSDIRDQSQSLDAAAYNRINLSLGTGAGASSICVECATSSYLRILGMQPLLGRIFMTDEDAERQAPGALLSYDYWQKRFGGDPGILGHSIAINGKPFSIIGVAPKGFRGVGQEAVDAWILLTVAPDFCSFTGRSLLGADSAHWLHTIGRLRDGFTLAQAEAEIRAQASPELQFELAASRDKSPELVPIQEYRRDYSAERLALWLAGGSFTMLVIACANVAGLSSIRAMDRKREITLRLQLGASRARILAQHAAEHILLALFCGIAAALTAGWISTVLQNCFTYRSEISPFDWRLFATACALALLAGILSGMIPALQASKLEETSLASSSKLRYDRKAISKALLVLQVALALLLVTGAGLFVRSVQNTRRGLGIDLDRVIIASLDFQKAGIVNAQEMRPLFERLADRIRHLPNVENASLSTGSLLSANIGMQLVRLIMGVNGKEGGFHDVNAVTPEYFSTVGTRIRSGRAFTEKDDTASERVTIIDEFMAAAMWPGEPALDKCVSMGPQKCIRVVGISESRRRSAAFRSADGEIFVPYAQAAITTVPHAILIRTRGPAIDTVSTIATVARNTASQFSFMDIRPTEDLADTQARSWRLGRTIFSLFGSVSLLLASMGLYAILSFSVRQRTSEIGVRMAMGATMWDILQHVLRQGLLLVAAGWLLGIGAALLLMKYIEKLLFQIKSIDIASLIFTSLIVLMAGVAGCLIPSIRAANVNPVVALRRE